jgi:hypothetical protein
MTDEKRRSKMTQEISNPTTTQLTMPEEKNAFEAYADAVNRNRIIGELLKFSKGTWLAGRDGVEIEDGTELVAGVDRLEVGWVKWQDFRPVETRMGRVAEGFVPARRSELDDNESLHWPRDDVTGQPRDPWQLSNSLVLMDPESRQLFTFPTASKGGIGAIGRLAGIYGKRVRQVPGELPVIALQHDSYKHPNKQFGRIATPVFKVTGWVAREAFEEALEGAVEMAALEEAEAATPDADPEPLPTKAKPKGKPLPPRGDGKPRSYRKDEDIPF